MLSITCPECGQHLEIDDGFRGGVCRCSECGTMITVPQDLQPGPVFSQARELYFAYAKGETV